MKITKTQLKQIIKEEIDATMREGAPSINAKEIKRYEFPRGKTSYDDEEAVLPMIQKVAGDLEVSDPGMPNWDQSKDQIVYLGSSKGRGGQKVAYFKTSNTHHYYMLPL